MKWFIDLKIMMKLMIAFVVVAMIGAGIGYLGIKNVKEINESDIIMYEKVTVPIAQMGAISTAFERLRVNTRDIILANDPQEVAAKVQNIKELRAEIDKNAAAYEKLIMTKDMKEAFEVFKKTRSDYVVVLDQVMLLAQSNRDQEAKALIGVSGKVAQAEQDAIAKMVAMKIEDASERSEINSAQASSAIKMMLMLIALGLLLSLALGFLIARMIGNPIKKLAEAADKVAVGDVDVNIEINSKDEVGILANSFQKMAINIRNSAYALEKIAAGDVNVEVKMLSDKDVLGKNLGLMVATIKELLADTNRLITATQEGKLDTRGNAQAYKGGWSELIGGVNKLIDAFVGPINVTAEYVDRISKGDIPPKITDVYYGDFNEIKNNLNQCIDAMNGLIAESLMLTRAAVEGQLQTRGTAEKFEGSYREIVKGVNDTLDAVLKPVEEAAACLAEMARGNLDVQVAGKYLGDHAVIKDSLNNTLDGINDILQQVTSAVDQISAASHEIASSSQALSQGATESASAIEETTSSMHEMASQTNQNADNAIQANQLAIFARDNAEKGNVMMGQMVKAMVDINESSTSISKIIKVIDEIAFQTNLLALNAAVEAARAGKHGKGFTVVAEEVRNLAQRSAKAAKETTEMIEDSIKKTEVGTKIAEDTSGSLSEIVTGATKVTDLISEIAAASKEQAQGISQINTALGQVDQVTQQNTASAEEMASASEEMSSQAVQLKGMLGKFKLKKRMYSGREEQLGDLNHITPEMIRMMEQMLKKQQQPQNIPWGGASAQTQKPKPKQDRQIILDDNDFGKF